MARRGPKGQSPESQAAKGETRPSRKVVTLFKDHASRPDPDTIPAPKGMNPDAKRLWKEKTERYRQRGQKISGFEDALRQYCELEAAMNKLWRHTVPTMAMIAQHRMWSSEFYDTPASHKVRVNGGKSAENRFGNNGRKAG